MLGFNDMSTLVGHFVLSPREREKRDRRNEREGQGRKRNRNESEETEEIHCKNIPPSVGRPGDIFFFFFFQPNKCVDSFLIPP